MNSENSKTSKPHISKLKLTDKLDLRIGETVIKLSLKKLYFMAPFYGWGSNDISTNME